MKEPVPEMSIALDTRGSLSLATQSNITAARLFCYHARRTLDFRQARFGNITFLMNLTIPT